MSVVDLFSSGDQQQPAMPALKQARLSMRGQRFSFRESTAVTWYALAADNPDLAPSYRAKIDELGLTTEEQSKVDALLADLKISKGA